jgi:hypothetical protein
MVDDTWSPSTLWQQAGPLIEDYAIGVQKLGDNIYSAWVGELTGGTQPVIGETHLVAAMRQLALLVLGEEAEVPDELVDFNTDESSK